MFVNAIEAVGAFTRPIHSISRNYGSQEIIPGASSLFFVNSDGWALTCKHVAELLPIADKINAKKLAYLQEINSVSGKNKNKLLKAIKKKYGYTRQITYEIYNTFVNCIEGNLALEIKFHQNLDIALIKFNNYTRLFCESFPVFAANGDNLKQGKFLCRLGFPFPEFSNFEYKQTEDKIQWTSSGRNSTPRFPIEGMVTRHLLGPNNTVTGFELSTPGLKGQSGGPCFDVDGRIWGMQSKTGHLDLDFDVDIDVVRGGTKKRIKDSAFLHVGHCLHVNELKTFMRQHNVTFLEG